MEGGWPATPLSLLASPSRWPSNQLLQCLHWGHCLSFQPELCTLEQMEENKTLVLTDRATLSEPTVLSVLPPLPFQEETRKYYGLW